MEAMCSSETSVNIQRTTRHYIPEDGTLHNHCCENLKSYMEYISSLSISYRNRLYAFQILFQYQGHTECSTYDESLPRGVCNAMNERLCCEINSLEEDEDKIEFVCL
jgi:hypothetical protein